MSNKEKKSVRVKVIANVKREGVEVARDGRLIISVHAPRKEGRANERMRELLAAHFGVSVARVLLVDGRARTTKQIVIT